jgi:hypothetical protein
MLTQFGEYEEAREVLDASLTRTRAIGDRQAETAVLFGQATLALRQGRTDESLSKLREALLLARQE